MLARVAVHLPEPLWVPENARYQPFSSRYRGEEVVLHPPLQSAFEIRPADDGTFNVNDLYRLLTPSTGEQVYRFVRMDGAYVKHANLLQIDFVRQAFNRQSGEPPDPPSDLIEHLVRNMVARLRYTIGAPRVREFRLLETYWTIRYLTDEAADLPEEKGLVRGRLHAPFKFQFTGLDQSSWKAVQQLSFDFQPQIWERLYLDALFLLPEVGPALTLALAAIESAANQMIRDCVGDDSDRARRLIKSKRLPHRLGEVARVLSGTSLQDQPLLWSAFDRLRRARNAAAHEGTPVIDSVLVTDEIAQQMILQIRPVLDWIEQRMPPSHRSHRDPYQPKWEWGPPVESVASVDPRDTSGAG